MQFHVILMFFKLKSYLKLCFLIFFISDIQNLISIKSYYTELSILSPAVFDKGDKRGKEKWWSVKIVPQFKYQLLTHCQLPNRKYCWGYFSFRIKSCNLIFCLTGNFENQNLYFILLYIQNIRLKLKCCGYVWNLSAIIIAAYLPLF